MKDNEVRIAQIGLEFAEAWARLKELYVRQQLFIQAESCREQEKIARNLYKVYTQETIAEQAPTGEVL